MVRLTSALVISIASAALGPAVASATTYAPPPEVAAPVVEEPGVLALLEESFEAECVPEDDLRLACRVDARHVYRFVASEAHLLVPVAPRVTVGGRLVEGGQRIPITGAAGERLEVRVHHRLDAYGHRPFGFYLTPALVTRHPLLGESAMIDTLPAFVIRPSDASPLTASVPARITVRAPGFLVRPYLPGEPPNAGTPDRHELTVGPREAETRIYVELDPDHPPIYQGGPFVGAGGDPDDGFRLRAGWEIGFHALVVASLAVETDFDDEVVIAPVLEGALPTITIVPSLAVGLGVPVRLTPEPRGGLRVQLTASYYVSFVATIDWFVADDDPWRFGLYGQIGL